MPSRSVLLPEPFSPTKNETGVSNDSRGSVRMAGTLNGNPSPPPFASATERRWVMRFHILGMPTNLPSRDEALALQHEYTQSESLRKHMLAVEAAMRAYAKKFGEDPERWGLAGLIHDFDYERHPNSEHSPTEGHPAHGVSVLR